MPPIILTKAPIAYYGSPKVACTSIKLALYELEHGVPWVDYKDASGNWHYIHGGGTWFPAEPTVFTRLPDPDRWFKFAVIRDPIDRLLSAYGNRVVHYGELSAEKMDAAVVKELDLKADPDLPTFLERLDDYRRASKSIRYHTDLQSFFIGTDLAYFDKVYKMSEIAILPSDLFKRTGFPVKLLHSQQGGPRFRVDDLTARQKDRLIETYQKDYDMLGHYYSPPAKSVAKGF